MIQYKIRNKATGLFKRKNKIVNPWNKNGDFYPSLPKTKAAIEVMLSKNSRYSPDQLEILQYEIKELGAINESSN